MTDFRFHDPLWLLAALPLAFVVWYSLKQRKSLSLPYSSFSGLTTLPVTLAQRVRRTLPWVRTLALILVVGALARPQQGLEQFKVTTEGVDIVLAIDRSGSMDALDFVENGERVNRLHAVKSVVSKFVEGSEVLDGRPDDRIALVVFGGYAEGRCPLTLDHGTLLDVLRDVKIPGEGLSLEERRLRERFIEDEAATAIGDALARSVAVLKDRDAESRIVILLSDGENTAGVIHPLAAAELAKESGVKVYTVGIGSTGFAPFKRMDSFGREFLDQQQVRLDEATLRSIASTTGGEYFNARDIDHLERVYSVIDELEKTEAESVVYTDYRELFSFLLLPGLSLLLLELLLRNTRFLGLP